MKRIILVLAISLLITLLTPTSHPSSAEDDSSMSGEEKIARVMLIYYGGYDTKTEDRIRELRPAILVTNTPNDRWQSQYSLRDIPAMQMVGIKVFGVTTAAYETMDRTPDGRTQEDIIRGILEFDKADGVFVDQCSALLDEARIQYHKRYAQIVHSYGKLYFINTGLSDFDERWFTEIGADLVNGSEHWHAAGYPNTAYDPSPIQMKYPERSTVMSFPLSDLDSARDAVLDAYAHGLAYAYVNGLHFLTIDEYWEELAEYLRDPEIPAEPEFGGPPSLKVTVPQIYLEKDGWIVLHPRQDNGEPDLNVTLGKLYMYPGLHTGLQVEMTGESSPGKTVCAVLHRDDPYDQIFSPETGDDPPLERNGVIVKYYFIP